MFTDAGRREHKRTTRRKSSCKESSVNLIQKKTGWIKTIRETTLTRDTGAGRIQGKQQQAGCEPCVRKTRTRNAGKLRYKHTQTHLPDKKWKWICFYRLRDQGVNGLQRVRELIACQSNEGKLGTTCFEPQNLIFLQFKAKFLWQPLVS